MTLDHVLAMMQAAGFRHVVTLEGEMNDDGFKLGARGDYRMWHPLLCKPGSKRPGSAYVGSDDGQLDVSATGAVANCFVETLGVPPTQGLAPGPGDGPRWRGSDLEALMAAISRRRN